MNSSLPDAEFPEKLQPVLTTPKRYKVLWGGRGAGRSWGVARFLLLQGLARPIRVLCARELQNSITESVHQVLEDQIDLLGLRHFYDVQRDIVFGSNGTEFSFAGIKNNVNKIRSYEGIDYCWVEEAHKVSKHSWGVLIPTIRKEGSEIWMTFNPELADDYTYKRFVVEAQDRMQRSVGGGFETADSVVVKMTWRDNPWFPRVLREEMERDRERDPDHWLWVWEGNCIQQLEGAIYARELRRAREEGRIGQVPYDKLSPVDTFWDLGHFDATAIWFGQRIAMHYRLLSYYAASGEDITHFIRELQSRRYVYGRHFLPHDARAKHLGTKKSIEEMLRVAYPRGVYVVPKLSVVDGINAARVVFGSCWFDERGCEDGLNALRHYQYRVVDGHLSAEPLHNWASDGADAFRMFAIAMKQPQQSPRRSVLTDPELGREQRVREWTRGAISTGLGWMR